MYYIQSKQTLNIVAMFRDLGQALAHLKRLGSKYILIANI